MVHDVAAELAAVVAETVRKPAGDGIHQDLRGTERGRAQEDHLGVEFHLLVRFRIQHTHAAGPVVLRVMDELVDDRIGPQRHVSGFLRRRKRAGVAAEVSPERTAAPAQIAVLAGAALRAVRERRGEIRGPADGERAAHFVGERLLQVQLDAIQLHRRQEFAVRQLLVAFRLAAHADETLHVVVPRRELLVADGPVHGDTFFRVRLEVHRTPAVRLPTPHDGTAADVIAAHPGERLASRCRDDRCR